MQNKLEGKKTIGEKSENSENLAITFDWIVKKTANIEDFCVSTCLHQDIRSDSSNWMDVSCSSL